MFVCIPKFIFRSSVANSKLYFCFTSKNFLNWTESIFCGLSIRQRRLSPFPHRVLLIQWRYWTIESRTFDGGTEWNFSQIPLEPNGYLSNLTLSFWTCWILEPNANYYAGSDEIFFEFGKIASRHSGFEPHTSRHFSHWATDSARELLFFITFII